MKILSSKIGGFCVFFLENVLNVFNHYIKDYNEAGGILLGKIYKHSIYINKVSIPNKYDRSFRFSYIRNRRIAQVIIDYEFLNSDRRIIYLGEWHTHKEDYPKPSNQDIKMIKEQFLRNIINEKFLLLVIKGLDNLYVGIYDGKRLFGKNIN